jgi:ariadne-1
MDMDTYNEDFKVTSGNKKKAYEIDYESLSQAAVEKLMQADIEHICGILGVDVSLSLYWSYNGA